MNPAMNPAEQLQTLLLRLWESACAGAAQRPSCTVEDGRFVFRTTGAPNLPALLQAAGVPSHAAQSAEGNTLVWRWPSVADAIFGPGGRMATALPGYEPRPAQMHMARLIQRAIEMRQPAVIEAGTGTGKSFAYAAVAMAMDRTVIISTSNKNLQGQLVRKDMPFLQTLFPGKTVTVAVGKGNYVCKAHVEDAAAGRVNIQDPALREWYFDTETGNVEDLPFAAPVELADLTADDDCTSRHCPLYAACFYYWAKDERKSADVIVTNHALLCRHAAWPVAGILPNTDLLVVDEAHQLANYARNTLGHSLTAGQLRRLVGLAAPYVTPEALQFAEAHVDAFAAALQARWAGVTETQIALPATDTLAEGAALERALYQLSHLVWGGDKPQDAAEKKRERRSQRLFDAAEQVRRLSLPLPDQVRWLERAENRLEAHVAPVDVSDFLGDLGVMQTTVFTSATLATPTLAPFLRQAGLPDALQLVAPAPFDYAEQALLYAPPAGAPLPHQAEWRPWLVEELRGLVTASRGGAFLLFTSYAAMQYALGELRRFFEQALRLPVYVQGTLPRAEIARRFRADGNAVLFATKSFFEGVDIPGDALRLVVVDKLPFEAPSPLGAAMETDLAERLAAELGRPAPANAAFTELRLPEMIITLKQAAGRLIRTQTDRGVLAVLDARLRGTPYGRRTVLPALPPMPLTSKLTHVQAFFAPHTAPALLQRTPPPAPVYGLRPGEAEEPTAELWG